MLSRLGSDRRPGGCSRPGRASSSGQLRRTYRLRPGATGMERAPGGARRHARGFALRAAPVPGRAQAAAGAPPPAGPWYRGGGGRRISRPFPDLHDAPQVHHCGPVADVAHCGQVVRDQDGTDAEPVPQVGEEVEDGGLHGNVQGRDRLVGHQDLRFDGERPGDGYALALASRERRRVTVQSALGQPDKGHQLPAAALDARRPGPGRGTAGAPLSTERTDSRGLSEE